MNNRGQIVFSAWLDNATWSTEEIFLFDSTTGVLTQITDDDVQDVSPDINDDGVIVWSRGVDPEIEPGRHAAEIVMLPQGVGGPLLQLTDDDEDDFMGGINNLGQVVWMKSGPWFCGGPSLDIWMFDGASVFPITTDAATLHLEHQSPVINDLGQIVWTRYDFCNPPSGWYFTSTIVGKLSADGGIVTLSNAAQNQPQGPAINNLGDVVIGAWDGAALVNTVDVRHRDGTTERIAWNAGSGDINDAGDVAFERWDFIKQEYDVWLYRNGVQYRLTQDGLNDIQPCINNAGQIAWTSGEPPSFPDGDIKLLDRLPAGDMNCDGTINQFDIIPFVVALSRPGQYDTIYPSCDRMLADANRDGSVNQFDIQSFVDSLIP